MSEVSNRSPPNPAVEPMDRLEDLLKSVLGQLRFLLLEPAHLKDPHKI
jgi:hypothetical protein